MWRLLAVALIFLPATVMAKQGGGSTLTGDDFLSLSGAWLVKATEARPRIHPNCVPLVDGQFPALAAANGSAPDKGSKKAESVKEDDIDLRYVDWDEMKAGKSGKDGNGVSEKANGDGDNEDEEEKDEKEGGDKEGGGGGWDRPWDAPKLG